MATAKPDSSIAWGYATPDQNSARVHVHAENVLGCDLLASKKGLTRAQDVLLCPPTALALALWPKPLKEMVLGGGHQAPGQKAGLENILDFLPASHLQPYQRMLQAEGPGWLPRLCWG